MLRKARGGGACGGIQASGIRGTAAAVTACQGRFWAHGSIGPSIGKASQVLHCISLSIALSWIEYRTFKLDLWKENNIDFRSYWTINTNKFREHCHGDR